MARLPNPNAQARPTPKFGGMPPEMPVRDEAAKAQARMGQAVVGLSEAMFKAKSKDDKFQVEAANTALQQARLDLRDGEGGYSQVKSADVTGNDKFASERMNLFDDQVKEIAKNLGNDEQKTMFNARAAVSRVGHNQDLTTHITRERDAFNAQVYTGGLATKLDIAAADYASPGKVKFALMDVEHLTKAEADRLAWPEDLRKSTLKENKSNIHETVIRKAIDEGNHYYAKEWYGKNQKNILGTRQGGIEKLLRVSGIREESQAAADGYDTEQLSKKDSLTKARKITDPETRDATVTRINARWGEKAQQLDADQKAAGEEAWELYANNKNLDDVPLTLLNDMDGKERLALEGAAANISAGTTIKNGSSTYYELKQKAVNDPLAFKELNLMAYAADLSPSDRKELMKLQTDEVEIKLARTKSLIMKQGAVNVGISEREVRKGFGKKIEAFYIRIDDELKTLQASTGKPATTEDVDRIVNNLTLKTLRDPDAWYFTGERSVYGAEIEGVPKENMDELAGALVRMGEPVTDDNIKRMWAVVNRGK